MEVLPELVKIGFYELNNCLFKKGLRIFSNNTYFHLIVKVIILLILNATI